MRRKDALQAICGLSCFHHSVASAVPEEAEIMCRVLQVSFLLGGIVLVATAPVRGTPIPVPNGDFEASLTTFVGGTGSDPPDTNIGGGWIYVTSSTRAASGVNDLNTTVYTSFGSAADPTPSPASPNSAGKTFVRFTGGAGSTGTRTGTINSPSLGVLVAEDMIYTLTVAVGNRSDTLFPSASNSIALLTAGTPRATQAINGANLNIPIDGTWDDIITSFTTDSTGTIIAGTGSTVSIGTNVLGQSLTIRLVGQTTASGGPQDIEFDTVRLDATSTIVQAVPEPGTFALAALGLAGWFVVVCRQRQSLH
jgi:hypothetical protein